MTTLTSLTDVQALAARCVAAADGQVDDRFASNFGVRPAEFASMPVEQQQAALEARARLSGFATSADRMAHAMAQFAELDEHEMHDRIGEVVYATSDDPKHQSAMYGAQPSGMAGYSRGTQPDSSGTTVFFLDRIPAGIEERVIAREMFQLHAWRVEASERRFLSEAVAKWETWGASGNGVEASQTRGVYDAVEKRIDALRPNPQRPASSSNGRLPSSLEETRFAFAVQEAVKQGVRPDVKGKGVSGWLHEVAEHVTYVLKHTTGHVIKELEPEALVEIVRLDSPFAAEVRRMRDLERSRRYAERAEAEAAQRKSELLVSDFPEIHDGGRSLTVVGFYESGEPVLVVFERQNASDPDDVRILMAGDDEQDVTSVIVAWADVPVAQFKKPAPSDSPAPGM